jgi:hypothetical protein
MFNADGVWGNDFLRPLLLELIGLTQSSVFLLMRFQNYVSEYRNLTMVQTLRND